MPPRLIHLFNLKVLTIYDESWKVKESDGDSRLSDVKKVFCESTFMHEKLKLKKVISFESLFYSHSFLRN